MRKINTLKIYLLDNKQTMVNEWDKYFKPAVNVYVVKDEFAHFMEAHPEDDCVVLPANSFGLMDGGYERAITKYFGILQKTVLRKILDELYGEHPVASSISANIPSTNRMLIHTPTMRIPERIIDTKTVYHCTRTTLIEAMRIGVTTIVLPAFVGECGGQECEELARMMLGAYMQLSLPHKEIKWENTIDYTRKGMWNFCLTKQERKRENGIF